MLEREKKRTGSAWCVHIKVIVVDNLEKMSGASPGVVALQKFVVKKDFLKP